MKKIFLLCFVALATLASHAIEIDYTDRVSEAACNTEQSVDVWTLDQTGGDNGILRFDTWSSRGGKDGSNMTTPFLEYWSNWTTLSDATLMHEVVTGLPAGTYRLTALVRGYNEYDTSQSDLSGAYLMVGANEYELFKGVAERYNNQPFEVEQLSVEFKVGAGGKLNFGFVLRNTNISWLSFKEFRLVHVDGVAGERDGGADPNLGEEGSYPDRIAPQALKTGTYYLRNVFTGKYLYVAGNYGTQAMLGDHAIPVGLTKLGGNSFIADAGFSGDNGNNVGIMDNILYIDMPASTWDVEPNKSGYYTIEVEGELIGYDGISDAVHIGISSPNSKYAQWELLTREQMLQEMLAGKLKDATYLIENARMDRNYANSGAWVDACTIGGDDTNRVMESWNSGSFDAYQVLENIPNGTYRLSCQGYYRYNISNGWWGSSNTNANSSQGGSFAFLYGNNVTKPLMKIEDELGNLVAYAGGSDGANMPFGMGDASKNFSAGLYADNVLEVDVTDHTLRLGVKKTQQQGCDWAVWDNFELALVKLGNNTGYSPGENAGGEDVSGATWDNPEDVTAQYIKNADMSSTSGWSGSPELSNGVARKSYNDLDVYQTARNVPKGWYRLSVQGFYRFGDISYEQQYSYDYSNQECVNNQVYAMYTIPYATISRQWGIERQRAVLYANDYSVGLPSIFEDAYDNYPYNGYAETEFGYVPNSSNAANWAFNQDKYNVELVFPVFDGTIRLGVRKKGGYKNDWTVFDNFKLEYLGTDRFVYAESVELENSEIHLSSGQTMQLSANVLPENVSEKKITWSTGSSAVAKIDANGVITGVNDGVTEVYAFASPNKDGDTPVAIGKVTVTGGYDTPSAQNIVINEIQVANIDMFVDPSYNYGGYVEIYNPSEKSVKLSGLKISLDGGVTKYAVTTGVAPGKGYGLIWFDHHDVLSSQINAKMDMEGGTLQIYSSGNALLASQTYPAAIARTSYARTTDGGNKWGITATPTPGESNALSSEFVDANNYVRLEEPVVSEESKVFTSPFTVKVDIPEGATLRYTKDGSTPTCEQGETSTDGHFNIEETTILRLRLFQDGKLPSAVKTLSYINDDKGYMLPVLSLVGDPVNFYDDTMGVFVPGTNGAVGNGVNYPSNWVKEYERPVAFNYFTLDGKVNYSQEADMERCGGWSRSWFPFSYKIKATSQYEGRNFIEENVFGEKQHLKHKVWQVRNGGNDLLCRIKDASLTHLVLSSGFHLDCQDYRPVHNFINGKYQGMLNIREPNNKHYGYANYGLDTEAMDALELGGGYSVKTGNATAFNKWTELASTCGVASNYQAICDMVDVEEFANYMAAQIYLGGDDWPGNNCKAFKGNDGKWHVVFFDVDQALRYDASAISHVNGSSSCPLIRIFRDMIHYSEDFRKKFITAYSIVAGSVYEPERVERVITEMAEEMEPALALEGLEPWTTAYNTIRVLGSTDRQHTMMTAVRSLAYINLSGTPESAVLQSNIEEGRLQLNGQDIPTGYFNGYLYAPCTITASAPEGYTFKGWVDSRGEIVSTDPNYTLTEAMELDLTATYTTISDDDKLLAELAMPVKVNEISAGNTVNINDLKKKNDWIELYNNTDVAIDVAGLYVSDDIDEPLKYQIPSSNGLQNTIIPARGHLIVWADKLEGVSQLHTNFKLSNADDCMVILSSSDQFVENNPAYFNKHPKMKNFVDGMTYVTHRGDQTVGRFPDAGGSFYLMNKPTIERQNVKLLEDQKVGDDVNLMPSYSDFFEYYLAQGWNWMSHNLDASIVFGQLPTAVQRVLSKNKEASKGSTNVWSGTLSNMDAGKMYKVYSNAAAQVSVAGDACDSNLPLSLNAGWNWLGYPVNGVQTLAAALKDFSPAEGDVLMSQDGFSLYSNGKWNGTLSSFETGKGYMYKSAESTSMSFSAPVVDVKLNKVRARKAREAKFGYDKNAYPNVMGIVAEIKLDGELITDDRFDLMAYADGECRGAAKWIDNLLFLNTYGQGGEQLTFKAVDNLDGTVYDVKENLTFAAGVEGDLSTPVTFTLTDGETGIFNPSGMAVSVHGSVMGYYSLSGILVGHRSTTLPEGVYIIKYSDGSHSKVYVR